MALPTSSRECQYYNSNMMLQSTATPCNTPLLHNVVPLNDENYGITMPIIIGLVVEMQQNNSNTLKHVTMKLQTSVANHYFDFDITNPSNFAKTLLMGDCIKLNLDMAIVFENSWTRCTNLNTNECSISTCCSWSGCIWSVDWIWDDIHAVWGPSYQLVFPKPLIRPFLLKYVKLLGFANQASLPHLQAPWGVTREWTAFVLPSGFQWLCNHMQSAWEVAAVKLTF